MSTDIEEYAQLNSCTKEHGIVIFGQNFFRTFPIGEMAYKSGIHTDIYNRSLSDTDINTMIDNIDVCVTALNPDKVFINIGEVDIKADDFNLDDFAAKYRKLIDAINVRTTADICIVNILTDNKLVEKANNAISKVAEETESIYINAGTKPKTAIQYLKLFDRLKCYMRDCPITFGEAFS